MAGELVTVYELSNVSLMESLLSDRPLSPWELPKSLSHWDAKRQKIVFASVESGLTRRRAADFMRWYSTARRRLGWRVVQARASRLVLR